MRVICICRPPFSFIQREGPTKLSRLAFNLLSQVGLKLDIPLPTPPDYRLVLLGLAPQLLIDGATENSYILQSWFQIFRRENDFSSSHQLSHSTQMG